MGEHLRGGYFTYHKAFRNSVPCSHTWGGTAAPWPRFVLPAVPSFPGRWHTTDSSLAELRAATHMRYFHFPYITDTAFQELPKSLAPCQTRSCAVVSPNASKACRKQQIWPPQAHSSHAQAMKRDFLVSGMEISISISKTFQLMWTQHSFL